jgi:hypothetical protein
MTAKLLVREGDGGKLVILEADIAQLITNAPRGV